MSKEKMTMKVCANPDCDTTFIMEESESFILEVGLPDNVKEESIESHHRNGRNKSIHTRGV